MSLPASLPVASRPPRWKRKFALVMILGGICALVLVGPEVRFGLMGKITDGKLLGLTNKILADGSRERYVEYQYVDNRLINAGSARISEDWKSPEVLKIQYAGNASRLAGTHDWPSIAAALVGTVVAVIGILWRRTMQRA